MRFESIKARGNIIRAYASYPYVLVITSGFSYIRTPNHVAYVDDWYLPVTKNGPFIFRCVSL